MSPEIANFGIALIGVLVAIVTFAFAGGVNKTVRFLVGCLGILVAAIFGFNGFVTLGTAQAPIAPIIQTVIVTSSPQKETVVVTAPPIIQAVTVTTQALAEPAIEVTKIIRETVIVPVTVVVNGEDAPTKTSGTPVPSNSVYQGTMYGVTFILTDARFENDNLIFQFMATNESEDKDILICYDGCPLIDINGDERKSKFVTSGESSSIYLRPKFRSGIKTRFSVTFSGIPRNTKLISALDVLGSYNSSNELFRLKDVVVPYQVSGE